MKKLTQNKLNNIVKLHYKWLRDDPDGKRADLSNMDLSGLDLSHANLSNAYLPSADLSNAYLPSADLSNAYLPGANLSNANISHVNFWNADLSYADLSHTDLSNVMNIDCIYIGSMFFIDGRSGKYIYNRFIDELKNL